MSTEENKPLGIIIQKFEDFETIIDSMILRYSEISTKLNILIIDKNFFDPNQNVKPFEEVKKFVDKLKTVNSFNNIYWTIQKRRGSILRAI